MQILRLLSVGSKFGKFSMSFSMSFLHHSSVTSSHPEVFLGKLVKICSKFTGEHPCRSTISIKLQSKLIEIRLRRGCSPVNLMYIFRTPFLENTSGWLLLFSVMTHKSSVLLWLRHNTISTKVADQCANFQTCHRSH